MEAVTRIAKTRNCGWPVQNSHMEVASGRRFVALRICKHEGRVILGAPHQVDRGRMLLVSLPREPCTKRAHVCRTSHRPRFSTGKHSAHPPSKPANESYDAAVEYATIQTHL